MFPYISVRSAHRRDVGSVSSMHVSYVDCICLHWLRSELDESARAWKAVLPTCCRPHVVFILSCNVIAPLSHPSERWNRLLPRAFFFARNHLLTSQPKNGLQPKCRIDTQISMFWNVGGRVSSRSILRPPRRHWETKKEDARRGEVREAVDGWHAWASRCNDSRTSATSSASSSAVWSPSYLYHHYRCLHRELSG